MSEDVHDLANRLFTMARSGDAAMLAEYLDSGVPVNMSNQSGDTLVMLASYHGHLDVVRLLIDRGADVNQANDKGQTPLAGVVFKMHDDVLDALLAAGADPTGGSPTAVETAEMFGREDLVDRFQRKPE